MASIVLLAGPAQAGVTFYTDEAQWTAAVGAGVIESLETTAANVALSDEVVSPPGQDADLGPQLTFRVATTGLCAPFVLQARQASATLVFDDDGGTGGALPPNTISVGDKNAFEEDDFRFAFPTRAVHAFGFFFVNNNNQAGEVLSVHGRSGLMGEIDGPSIPASTSNGSQFLGILADDPIESVVFEEAPGPDDMALRDFSLGCANEDPDADGLSNLAERRVGSDPAVADTDGDGLLDGEEVGTGLFEPRADIATFSGSAYRVSPGDFDGDGDADLVVAAGDSIEWLRNDGPGNFMVQTPLSTSALSARSVEAVDLDGDGDKDVLAASFNDDTISWFRNTDGLGSFSAEITIDTAADGARFAHAADFDGDGDLDVLASAFSDQAVRFYENTDGLGTFSAGTDLSPSALGTDNTWADDLDGDGDLDALSTNISGTRVVAWYENSDGAGGFATGTVIIGPSLPPEAVEAGDIDGDGDMDVVVAVAGSGFGVGWFENIDGLGTFGTSQTIDSGRFQREVLPTDIEGDGDLDVVWGSGGDIGLLVNTDGQGTFAPADIFEVNAQGASSIESVDLDGDGDLDLVAARQFSNGVAWYEQVNVSNPLLADSDGDGLSDAVELAAGMNPLAADEEDNGVIDGYEDKDSDGLSNLAEVRAGTDLNDEDTDDDGLLDGEEIGTGTFGDAQLITNAANAARRSTAADLDGDGDLDVLWAAEDGDIVAWHENEDGAGSFGDPQTISTLVSPTDVIAADLDGDGDLDVVMTSSGDDTVAWYENTDGLGTFVAKPTITTIADAPWSVVAADIDGDDDLDLVVAVFGDGEILWFENTDGLGSFLGVATIGSSAFLARSVQAADFDGDGDLDVLAASSGDDTIAWYENTNGLGAFGGEQVISLLADGPLSVFAVDVDRDGDIDVLSASSVDDEVAWYENTDGAGTFGLQQVIVGATDNAWSVFGADIEGDGDVDVLSASFNDDRLSLFLNTDGAGTFGGQDVIENFANGASSVSAFDIDGDGDYDLLLSSWLNDDVRWYPQLNVSDPLDPDSDDDGLNDGVEVAAGTSPIDADSDQDGLADGLEVQISTDPLDPDSEDDGICDGGLAVDAICTAGPDTCPLLNDPGQVNSDSLAAGDLCQCGDVTGDGVVDATDLLKAGKFVIGATVTGNFEVERCNLVGPEDAGATDCDVADLAALDRYLNGVPMPLVNQAACSVWGAP